MKKKTFLFALAVLFVFATGNICMASIAALPDNANVTIAEAGQKGVVTVEISGVTVTRVDVYEHRWVAPKASLTAGNGLEACADSNYTFMLEPGQGFNFQFVNHDDTVNWNAMTGYEYTFGQPKWLGKGLVILPVTFGGQKGAEIFIKEHIAPGLKAAIDSGQQIKSLFIN